MTEKINNIKYKCSECEKLYDNEADAESCEKNDKIQESINELRERIEFVVNSNHIKLLKNMYVDWIDVEYGAPCIDPKRPYGNSDVEEDISGIIGYDNEEEWDDEEEMWNEEAQKKLYKIHREMELVLQILLSTGQIKEGTYVREDAFSPWKLKKELQK